MRLIAFLIACLIASHAIASIVDYQPLTNGQLLIGSTGLTANPSTLTSGSTGSLVITNGPGSITLDTSQALKTTSSPTFAGLTDSALTLGSILFTGSGGLVSQSNTHLFWDNTNYRLGIGTLTGVASTDSALTISNNVSTLPPAVSGTFNLIHVGALDGVPNTSLYDSFGSLNQYVFRRADGTAASPSALQSGDVIAQFGWNGYGATAYQTNFATKITSMAAENWTDSTGAAVLQFFTRPSGSVSAGLERVRIDQNGNVGIGTTSPNAKLSLGNNVYTAPLGSSYGQYQEILFDSGTAAASYGFGVETSNMGFNSGGGYKFYQNGGATPMMVIGTSSNGNVGIGATNPLSPLQVNSPTGSYDTPTVAGFFAPADTNEVMVLARNVTQPQEMQIGVNQAGLYSEIQATHASVAYDNLILNRQGGSVGIANAAPSYTLDVNGTMRATTSITDGGFTSAQAGAPVSVNTSGTLVSGITNSEVSATAATTTTSATDVVLATITPAAGTYLVTFSTWCTHNTANATITASLYFNGAQKADSVRVITPFPGGVGAATLSIPISINAIVASNGSAVTIDWHTSGGTATCTQRTLDLVRLQ